ncbi:hypothetical protein FHW31_003702 [Enterobacter asburiae]|uniref:hypothetical protein n=1 Tax=Enterobacter asburiae TaxID=61645 RepID=UPI00141B9462|nr:hypothetical protein [Enterobacter asburiae]NIH92227.1 hypothetical protein [Enterobacter asburiae]
MKHSLLLASLLLNFSAANAGDWIFTPRVHGEVQITQQGSSALGQDTLVTKQLENETVTIQVIPAGWGVCQNGVLSGNDRLAAIQLPMISVVRGVPQPARIVPCGDSLQLAAQTESRMVGVQSTALNKRVSISDIPAELRGQRVLLGYVNFTHQNSHTETNAVYIDLANLNSDIAVLNAAFDKPVLRFGEVNVLKDNHNTARLTIRKTSEAGNTAMPYELSFESQQQRENSFQLKDSLAETWVTYKVKVRGRLMQPGDIYAGLVPAGSAATDIIDISFSLSGKDIQGLPAGTRLTDTLTAVIKPTP